MFWEKDEAIVFCIVFFQKIKQWFDRQDEWTVYALSSYTVYYVNLS